MLLFNSLLQVQTLPKITTTSSFIGIKEIIASADFTSTLLFI